MAIPSQDLMHCTVCKKDKPIAEMNKNSRKGNEKRCLACQRAYEAIWREKNREKLNAYHRDWRKDLGDDYRKYMVNLRKSKVAKMTPDELVIFRKKETDKSKRLSGALKSEVFTAYGGWKCACCGEEERSFLTIDHMQNNGSQLRREGVHGHSTMFYRWLKKSLYPKDFQVLCMNCQFGKRMNNGICPHQSKA
jgi:hypothetical protein